ncbi:MAG: PorV/PorQ family protein [Bacteroidota bacterium]|jgi:hypothetical protein
MIARLCCLLILLLHFCLSPAQAQNAPKYSNEFLSIGVGARSLGMAGSVVASASDVTSGYWNPAGLVLGKGDLQIGLMHSEYFAGIAKYDYGAVAAPMDATSTAGVSIIRFAIDDIIDSTDLIDADGNINYDRLKSFSAADYAFLFSYARQSKKIEGLRLGGNVKIIHRKVGDFANAWGFGLDVGAQYQKDKWGFGAVGKDITSTFNAWKYNTEELEDVFIQTGNEIPQNGLELTLPRLILGINYRFNFGERFSVLPEANLDFTFDGKRNVLVASNPVSVDPHFGVEASYRDFIFIRGGLGGIQQLEDFDGRKSWQTQPNFGVGIKIKSVSIDYALTNIGSSGSSLYSNIFSLKFAFFKQKK